MKSEKKCNAAILKKILIINEKYPELSKYLSEMPVTVPIVAHPEIGCKALKEYYESLTILVKKYDSDFK
jgi:hypothetical protein